MTLLRQFILRSIVREKLRVSVSVLGIALGVAVVVAIQMANSASVRGFQAAVETLAGKARLEITSNGSGISEDRLMSLFRIIRYGKVSPVIEGEAEYRAPTGEYESLKVLGVDILKDLTFREYHLVEFESRRREPTAEEFLRLLLDSHSVITSEKFAFRYNLRVGSTVDLTMGDRSQRFTIRGLLRDEGPAKVMDGNFILMDIAGAQLAFGRLGRIDRLELIPETRRSLGDLQNEISTGLPADLVVQVPTRRGQHVERMLEAFHFNLAALSYISMLVGLFLIYNTISISVISRRQEIGILRALGTGRARILILFLLEAALIAISGCMVGIVASPYLASLALRITGASVKALYIATAAVLPPLSWTHVVIAFGIGIPLSLLAALVPSCEASNVPPYSAISGADRLESRFRLGKRHLLLPVVFLALGAWLASFGSVGNIPIFGYLSAVAIVFGAAFLTPVVLYVLGWAGPIPLRKTFGIEGKLANANLKSGIPRISISVAALAVSLSMMAAIATMIESFRDTVIYWVGQTLQADLYVRPAIRSTNGEETQVSPQLEELIRETPGVAAVNGYRSLSFLYGDDLIHVGGGDLNVLSKHGRFLFKEPRSGLVAGLSSIDKDAVLVSESFSLKFGKKVGNEIRLSFPSGDHTFRIAAIYFDYSSDRGTVLMDLPLFVRLLGDIRPSSLAVYLVEGVSPEKVRSALLKSSGGTYRVYIHTNSSLRREVLKIFDSTFTITYALEFISIFTAILGVSATLLTLILERKKELALLRMVGADRQQVKRIVLIEALLLAMVSHFIGLATGLALSLVLIYVVNVQSFGWTIQFHFPSKFIMQSTLLIVAAAFLAGLYPAQRASRMHSVSELAEE